MTPANIKHFLSSAMDYVCSSISDYVLNPEKDFSRVRKLPSDKLIRFLIAQGASSTKNELVDFFGISKEAPTASAFFQQRNKLKSEALQTIFNVFNESVFSSFSDNNKYRFIAADGSTATFFSSDKLSPDEYHVSHGGFAKGSYSIHINAFYDLKNHSYTDALLQPVHKKDEYLAFCTIVDCHPTIDGAKNVYIGDRGYCSYNNMAHVIEKGQFFLFRTKDVNSKGLIGKFDLPKDDTFDTSVDITLVRSNSSKIDCGNTYRRFIDSATSFDYIKRGSKDKYQLSLRILRINISEDKYECIVTNLPKDEFTPDALKDLYNERWGIESSFRKLKYTIGLSNYHSCKPELIKQEIWAKLIAYNLTEALVKCVSVKKKNRKYVYKVNFSVAAHVSRVFMIKANKKLANLVAYLEKELIPIREKRKYSRLETAHFRKPKHLNYRSA